MSSLKVAKKAPANKADPKAEPPLRACRVVRATCPPGNYVVRCLGGRPARKFGRPVIQLSFEIAEGHHAGQQLPGWIPRREDSKVFPSSKYYQVATLALGREPEDDEDLDPARVLVGKLFTAEIGFSKKKSPRDFSDAYAKEQKGDGDFVRVHELLELIL